MRHAKACATLLLAAMPVFGAVTGTVINQSTGKPQAGATVGFNKLGGNGIELIDQAKSDANGNFTINQTPSGETPYLLRTVYDGVSYNHMLPPGSQATGIKVDVFNTSKQQGDAKITKHMILFEPANGQMTVNETYILENASKTAWNDSDQGTLKFFLPAGAGGKAQVQATAPGGMPIGAGVLKTGKPDIFGVDFPVKPGETRIDVTYSTTYTAGQAFAGKVPSKDENTYLIAPNGVTLAGKGLNDLGTEPRTQAHIYGLAGASYEIALTGTEAAPPGSGDASGGEQGDSSGPGIEQIMPRVYTQAKAILGIALGILALGFALLYRKSEGRPGGLPHK
jgi:hypothetical protein